MKMIGKNIDEKSSVGKSLSFGVGALVPNGGTLFNEIGDGLELIAGNVENLEFEVLEIKNKFFGDNINVAGLITGIDIPIPECQRTDVSTQDQYKNECHRNGSKRYHSL